ncbi:MAG: flagellar hook-basal body complex protein [Betaproteobacteria bacterium]|nr:flagellar hook-basal body complex protein [Betaproteobacteria bacterium]
MSFYTSLTGLNSASAQLGVTSNNIANVGTTGFKRSRADFGDIFATSPLQKASSTVGQGASLKQVSQEFSQGNVSFSSNALDLAVTGDGFFPLKSADGLQDIYTRNGAFMLNEQFNVVNSAGQRLMAATVDSTGSANVNERVVLTIPQKTKGEAQETSLIQLGVNFPADAQVISEKFNRANPATYNKSTALTVYDRGGNGYLATIYYIKTQNASQASPFNKWQTYVFVGDDEVEASLLQATDVNKEDLYVNKYGQIKPHSAVKDFLVNAKTLKFSIDELTDKRTSVPAQLSGEKAAGASLGDLNNGINISSLTAAQKSELSNLFSVDVDGSNVPASVDLSHLATRTSVTGTELAAEISNTLNRKFGGERYFDLSGSAGDRKFTIKVGSNDPEDFTLAAADLPTDQSKVTTAELVDALQAKLDGGTNTTDVTVSYDRALQSFVFKDSSNTTVSLSGSPVLGMTSALRATLEDGRVSDTMVYPNSSSSLRATAAQRFGLQVTYDAVNKAFTIASGTTGDNSRLAITGISDNSKLGYLLLGLSNASAAISSEATRGIASLPAIALGTAVSVNMNSSFAVDTTNNRFKVTVNDVSGEVVLPTGTDYSLATFQQRLQDGINRMTDSSGRTVNGVAVSFNKDLQRFEFTTGTTGGASFIKVSGQAVWGLSQAESGRGTTSSWIKPKQFVEVSDGVAKPMYIDEFGKETTNGEGFKSLPDWSPIFLDKGELTFDTGGNIVSPLAGTQLETVFLAGGKGALTINIDYSKSTQFSSPFAVLSQSQDGAPEGDLVGVEIAVDGLVSASYSNGAQKSLAKILLVNFSSPKGLRQMGDSSFLPSAASGNPILGTAGGAGFGTIRAGATERSNVDLTQELVDLITAQRNFQANAKAIETSTTMTQAIINIRG